jgi:hypothetical protein
MKIEELETSDIKIKPTKQNTDMALGVEPPFLNRPSVYVIAGAQGSGKSSFVNSIMTRGGEARVFKGRFSKVFYCSPEEVMSSEQNHPFSQHPKERVFHDLSNETFETIIEQALATKDEGENSALILDDWSEELKSKRVEQILRKLIHKHRHYHLQIIITLLTLKSLPKSLRSMIDAYIIFRPKSVIEVASFADDVFGLHRDDLKQLMDFVYSERYNFLFYNQRDNIYFKNFTKLKIIDER